ncbi:MAG: EAL domain-containing protein [Kibdelosporangium sp.]
MNSSLPESPGEDAIVRDCAKLARKWAHLLNATTYIPFPYAELEQQLLALTGRVYQVVLGDQAGQDAGTAIGERLVQLHCTGPTSLQVCLDVLGKGLLGMSALQGLERLPERILGTLGHLASGYAEKLRLTALNEQEVIGESALTAMRQAQNSHAASEARFDELVRCTSSGVAVTDADGSFLRTNEALAAILDHSAVEEAGPGLFDLVHPDDVVRLRADYRALLDGNTDRIHEWRRLVRADGEYASVSMQLSLLASPGAPSQIMVVAEDNTEVRLLQGQLNRQLLHDELTWLPNRQFFSSRLEKALRTADPAAGVSVYHLDLDAFSLITCGLGRRAGDQVLRVVAERLEALVAQENAMVARFGCDEFALLIENSAGTPDVATMVGRINDRLAEPIELGDHRVATSASIGVVHRPARDAASAEVLDSADLTLRRAKSSGCRQWELFDPARDAQDRAAFSLAVTMPGAWDDGEIDVLYQPVVRLADSRVIGVEALLDWDHPRVGPVPHPECVRLADQTGLIIPLGRWLLRTACAQVESWQRRYGHTLPVRVGLTASQASDPDLVGSVRAVLDETGLPAGQLRLGVPLEVLLLERGDAVDNIRLLTAAGVGIEADDFAMGSAGLLRLADLPVRTVKITRALTEWTPRLDDDSWQVRALRNLLVLIHQTGADVTVSSVDTAAQARLWRSLLADSASGPLFGAAQSPGDITDLLAGNLTQ